MYDKTELNLKMENLKISESKDYFIKGKEKFFYLADTCWSAFTNANFDEWEFYLNFRKSQGFNALQIDLLPQWDRSESENHIEPFETLKDGSWNFNKKNPDYFDRVEKMVEMAVERNFIPALVLLWCNYVKGTWGTKLTPSRIMPLEFVEEYVNYTGERYGKYSPIFIISGDTDFQTEEAIDYYLKALNTIKKVCPECLTTMHLCGGFYNLPEEFVNSPDLDFYMYQSSHGTDQTLPYKLAIEFYKKPVKRPIVNGEPCYEGICYGNNRIFTNFDVRKAMWQSLLSGAKAGITYGCHGIWPWHKTGKNWKQNYQPPYDWRIALFFPGAWDASYIKWIFEEFDLFDIQPANEKLIGDNQEIRISKGKDKIVIYTPSNWEIKFILDKNEKIKKSLGIELETRKVFIPEIEIQSEEVKIKKSPFNSDILYIFEGI